MASFEIEDKSVVEFQLGNKQLILLFMGLLVICSIFFFIGLRVGEDTAKKDLQVNLGESSGQTVQHAATQPADTQKKTVLPANNQNRSLADANRRNNVTKPATTTDARPQNTTAAAENKTESQAATTKPAENKIAASPNGSHYVQIAAFPERAKAEELRKKLPANVPTYIEQAQVNGKTWFRLRIGPFDTKDKAEEAKKALNNAYPDALVR